jgi:hypothetical protein
MVSMGGEEDIVKLSVEVQDLATEAHLALERRNPPVSK